MKFSKEDMQALQSYVRKAASSDLAVASEAQRQIATAIEVPIREVLLSGDIVSNIFMPMDFTDNPHVMFLLDLLTPGQEKEHYAYVVPEEGAIPEKHVNGDYIMVPTYSIGNGIDCRLQLIRDANMPVVQRMIQILEAGFIKKINDDGWQCLLAAATDRNILVSDPNASVGQFTPRLVTLLKTFMRRNGGGNSTTMNRSRVTDIYCSPEGQDDIRSWNLELVPDEVRTKIYYASDDSSEVINIYGVNIHPLDEFGESQEYQNYYTSVLAGSLGSDSEIGIALDLQDKSTSFVMPVREDLKIYEDNTTFRRGTFSLFGRQTQGFACLDSRRTLLFSF